MVEVERAAGYISTVVSFRVMVRLRRMGGMVVLMETQAVAVAAAGLHLYLPQRPLWEVLLQQVGRDIVAAATGRQARSIRLMQPRFQRPP